MRPRVTANLLPTFLLGVFLLPMFAVPALAQTSSLLHQEIEYRLVSPGSQPLKLAHGHCEPASFVVQVDGALWVQGEDYRVRGRSGMVVPTRNWNTSATGDSTRTTGTETKSLVIISYRFLPVPVTARQDLRPVGRPPGSDEDSDGTESLATGDGPFFTPELRPNAWRAGNLQVSGSKTVQVSSGNRREMTVDQNLRLNIMGQLTEDISVRAFLSDDNLPVVPEGNTEELKDIDKVLVEMTAPGWKATLGDFVARRQGTVFGNYRRKLQGFSLEATPGSAQVEVLAGSPRGLYRTLQVRGQEANQGPYYLGGGASSGNLFIVAGSERVTLDGEVLTRGQDRDYIIDYVRGTVTFTYRRLITAESTIVVEFEEGEGPFGRTVAGAGAGLDFQVPGTDLPANFSVRMIREKDDPGRLRTGELADEDQEVLAAAGDDPLRAVASGVVLREPGQGDYDRSLAGTDTIYVFNPEGGDYDVAFFYVGSGEGFYSLDSLTENGTRVFAYQGQNLGSYRIGRLLPLPTSRSLATFQTSVGDSAGDHVRAEWSLGSDDRNLLSERDNDDNQGGAGRVEGRIRPRSLKIGGRSFGTASLKGTWEKREANFQPFQLHRTVFDYDDWGLSDRARRTGFLDEASRESRLTGNWQTGGPGRSINLVGDWGQLDHGDHLAADRLAGSLGWTWRGGRGSHSQLTARARDTFDPLDITRTSRNHRLSWRLGPVTPSGSFLSRRWEDARIPTGRAGGYLYEETGVGLAAAPGASLDWRVDFKRGLADSLVAGDWQLQRDSRTFNGGVSTGRYAGMRLVGEGTLRRILSPGQAEQTTRLARLDLSGQWDRTGSDWSLGYRVDNSRTEVLDRQVVFVGESQGDYNQDGDFVGNNLGDHDMVLAGTDSLVATTAVLADLNWRQDFKFLGGKRWYGAWNSLTVAAIEGRSTTDDIAGLLALDPAVLFDNETTVLGDLRFTEELTFLQHLKTIDLRARFDFRETKDRQYADHPEDRLERKFELKSNLNVSRRSSLRGRWQQTDERRLSTESSTSTRRSYVSLTRRYEVGWNFRPSGDVRLGLQAEFLTRDDAVSNVAQKEYALRPTLRQRLARQWTVQADLRLAEVTSDEPPGTQRPWFYGYPGRNVESTLRVSWEPSDFLSVAANWFARKQGDRRWQHDLRLESTARF